MRGDSYRKARQSLYGYGSPPHAWGQLFKRLELAGRHGFTPTCVGTARMAFVYHADGRVHPHMRGDSMSMRGASPATAGSPPHAWGQPQAGPHQPGHLRFTPTCVGTARRAAPGAARCRVHPHMRGDSWTPSNSAEVIAGSPPHAWGQLPVREPGGVHPGFTPTCVGTAPSYGLPVPSGGVYPHMRGDSAFCSGVTDTKSGSPPHAWGQRGKPVLLGQADRFTPTCVGTATTCVPGAAGGRVHPTCVGTAAPTGRWPPTSRVHPHMRGDSTFSILWRPPWYGSPPHAWGQPCQMAL